MARFDFFKKHGIKYTTNNFKNSLATPTFSEKYFREINQRFSLNLSYQEFLEQRITMFNRYINKIRLNPGIENLLRSLKENNIRAVISSSNKKELIENILTKCNVREYFDLILGCDEVKNHKPHKEVFYKPLELLNLSASEVIGIEDAPHGVISINSAGLKSVAVISDYTTIEDFVKVGSSLIVSSTKEITFQKLLNLMQQNGCSKKNQTKLEQVKCTFK